MTVDPRDVTEAAKGVGEVAKLGRDVYVDLVSPTSRAIGETLGHAVRVALKPAEGILWSAEQSFEWLAAYVVERLASSSVQPHRLQTPEAQTYLGVAVGVASAGTNEELRHLFGNLLATAMDSKTANLVHPGFAGVLKELSAVDAPLLRAIFMRGALQLCETRATGPLDPTMPVTLRYVLLTPIEGFDYERHFELSQSNLVRLGVCEIQKCSREVIHQYLDSDLGLIDLPATHALGLTAFGHNLAYASIGNG